MTRIAPRFGVPIQDRDDLVQDVALSLVRRLGSVSDGRLLPCNLDVYVRACVANACRTYIARLSPQQTRVRDGVVETLRGRRGLEGFALWEYGGIWVGGCEAWFGRAPASGERIDRVRGRPEELETWLDRTGKSRHVPALVAALFDWIGQPIALNDIVSAVSKVLGPGRAGIFPDGADDPNGIDLDEVALDPLPTPDEIYRLRETCVAMGLYASGLQRGRLCAWLWSLDRENVAVLFSACREPSGWMRRFGDSLQPGLSRTELEALVNSGNAPGALRRRYADRLAVTLAALRGRLRRLPHPDVLIARFLSVSCTRVAYLRWAARQELAEARRRAFDTAEAYDAPNKRDREHSVRM